MRIIGGTYKGKRIDVPKGFKARPTTDFAKENIFNIIQNHFDFTSVDVLDLFAGTGSISYEFASREVISIDSVELNTRSVFHIQNTAQKLNFSQIKALKSDAFKFIQRCKRRYDIIFADPPYDNKNIGDLPKLVFSSKILKENGWFILEHGQSNDFAGHQNLINRRKYGSVHFSIFSHKKS